jgi:hypothetical protein
MLVLLLFWIELHKTSKGKYASFILKELELAMIKSFSMYFSNMKINFDLQVTLLVKLSDYQFSCIKGVYSG